jgi:hypothetical protein
MSILSLVYLFSAFLWFLCVSVLSFLFAGNHPNLRAEAK